ncbi:MAG: FmdB family zinc ribbon protein [Candidatus Kapaibacterium sp.]
MPIYVYKCLDCETKYEIFHKSSEKSEDIVCPTCGSNESKKLMAASNIGAVRSPAPAPQSCDTGSCATGMCPFN